MGRVRRIIDLAVEAQRTPLPGEKLLALALLVLAIAQKAGWVP